ncbi:DEAD/DEAH box helicase [bacterium]|nr:DEAD/DEAH box helicase [bacterium]
MTDLNQFEALGLDERSLMALDKKGFEEPTPIQKEVIPILLKNEVDVIGQAMTGTGKTAAFGLPIIENLDMGVTHVQAIILTPTRELAIQVAEEIYSLRGGRRFKVLPIYGGQSISGQLRRLKSGVEIVVGTPGRILDHIGRKTLDLSKISFLVLDEADEMLNMGFIDDIETIIEATNDTKRVALFSATMPARIRQLSKKYMGETKLIRVENKQLTTDLTEQIYFEVNKRDKLEALCRIIDLENEFYGLIFCRTKVAVDELANRLIDRGYNADGLHGDISQQMRIRILDKFKEKRTMILVATDVAARGLDVQDLSHVINYSLPQDPLSYIHRIGRTGRAGKTGTAITFITPDEYRKLSYIKREAKTDIQKGTLPEVEEIIDLKRNNIITKIDAAVKEETGKLYRKMAQQLLQENYPEDVIAAIIKMTYSDELDASNYTKMRAGRKDRGIEGEGKTRVFVSLGKKDGYTPKKVVEFIKNSIKIKDRFIDDVTVMTDFSFVTLPYQDAEEIIALFKKKAKGKLPLITKANKPSGGGNSRKNFKGKKSYKGKREGKRSFKGRPARRRDK